jgi:DNA-nicking Smr family endonuclease
MMNNSPVHIPIEGVLDLHTFAPQDASGVVDEYLCVCAEKGILEVKIIHGKGTGVLRRTVESAIKKHPLVQSYKQDPGPSGWGATLVFLRRSGRSTDGRKI